MLVYGMILALPGTVIGLPEFTARFSLSLADRGTLIASLFGGVLAGSIASGPVVAAGGYRWSISISAAVLAALLPSFAFASSYGLAVAVLAALGFASATLNTAANALSSDLFPGERARRMTGLALAFGLGGLAMPAATAIVSAFVSWRAIAIGGAAVSALTAIAGARGAPLVTASPAQGVLASVRDYARQPGFGRICLLLICAAANEVSFAGWTSTYLTASGFTPGQATWGLSSHWLGLVTGRLLFANRVDRAKRPAIIRSALAGAAVMLVLIAAPVTPVLVVGPFMGGVAIAVIFATALALAGDRFPGHPGALFGALLTVAQLGGMLLPPLVGAVSEAAGLRAGLLLVVANGLAIAWLAFRSPAAATIRT
jgi:fucose permease